MKRLCTILTALSLAAAEHFPREASLDTATIFHKDTPHYSTEEAKLMHQMRHKAWVRGDYDLERDFYLLFRVLHEDMLPLWQTVIADHPDNPLLKINYLHALSRLGDSAQLSRVASWRSDSSAVIRQYVAVAYGDLGSPEHVPLLQQWHEAEENGFVKRSLTQAIADITTPPSDRIDYLPVYFGSLPLPTVEFFYNVEIRSIAEMDWEERFDELAHIPNTRRVVYPHQMFGLSLKRLPLVRFGNRGAHGLHVGEDSGWPMQGLPVHAIADGVVRYVSHDSSWGNLVVIESRVKGQLITHLYGHLAEQLTVRAGERVGAGQPIGRIGRSVSYENGGYWAHLHLGIQKAAFRDAIIAGYSWEVGNFISMEELRALARE